MQIHCLAVIVKKTAQQANYVQLKKSMLLSLILIIQTSRRSVKASLGDYNTFIVMTYLRDGTLPEDDKLSCKIVLEVNTSLGWNESSTTKILWSLVVGMLLPLVSLVWSYSNKVSLLVIYKVYDGLKCYVWWRGMKSNVHKFCKAYLFCDSCKESRRTIRPPVQPITVGGLFHRVAVGILPLPLTLRGNCYMYVTVFMDYEYLTKWPEVFAIPDQKSETIAQIFVEEIVCHHGIPEELLSDCGANIFLLQFKKSVGYCEWRRSGYHPQTDGLVKRFNSTFLSMITKSCDVKEQDWDDYRPYLLFGVCLECSERVPIFLFMQERSLNSY